jgi:hypothetical protein
MEQHLPAFKEKNPHLEVVTELVRGQHPNLKGIYSKMIFSPYVTLSYSLNFMLLQNVTLQQ